MAALCWLWWLAVWYGPPPRRAPRPARPATVTDLAEWRRAHPRRAA